MKTPLTPHLKGPIGAVLLLLTLLLLLLFLPNPQRPTRSASVAHSVPLILRYAPVPVSRHVQPSPSQSGSD